MKKVIAMLAFATTLFLIVGCGADNKKKETTKDEVKKELKEAVEASKGYLESEFNDIVNNIEGFAQKTEDKISELKKKAEKTKGETKENLDKKIKEIEQKSDALKSKVKEYKSAAKDKKGEIKKEIENLKEALDKSIETFNEEME